MMQMQSVRLSLLQIHLAVLLAGGAGLFAKVVTVSPAVITCARTFFGSLVLAIAAWVMGASLRISSGRDVSLLLLSGAMLAVHWFAFFVSIQVATVAIGLLAFSSFPLFVTFLEPVVFSERLRRFDVITSIVVVAGLVLVTPSWDLSNHLTQGLLWGIFGAFTFAVFSLLSRSSVKRYPTLTVSFYQQATACICAFPFAWQWNGPVPLRDVAMLIVLGVVFTGVAQALAVASLRHLRAQTVGVAYGLEPVYGILFASLLLNEQPSTRTLCGGALIVAAVVASSFKTGDTSSAVTT
jgi:drug/metabolite transporter (DMT)-like permease